MHTHIVCPHCDAVNRLPTQRLHDPVNCGQCHRALFSGQPLELNKQNFDRHLQRNDIPVLVDFWAPWCGPCKMMAPAFAQLAQQSEPQIRCAKVNTEVETLLASKWGIRSIPTLILFKSGQEIARQAGAITVSDMMRWVNAQRL